MMKRRSILLKIFTVILILAVSLIMFIWAAWGVFINKPNAFYAHIHFIITIIILILTSSFIASYIIRRILKPLTLLNDAVEKAASGDLNQQISIKSNDELGTLANAFNKMTRELNKMLTAREQLLSDVSHELRTPITRAKLALEMMPDSAEKHSLTGDLHDMEDMITGILESERLRNSKLIDAPEISVPDLLYRLNDYYRNNSDRIIIHPISENLRIQGDFSLLMTVLRNVVDNGLKYSSSENGRVDIGAIRDIDHISIYIEDNGPGIPEEKIPFITEPFYRADESRSRTLGGYGLGLHLCKRIMDLHHAAFLLENKKEGKGLMVTLTFPLKQ